MERERSTRTENERQLVRLNVNRQLADNSRQYQEVRLPQLPMQGQAPVKGRVLINRFREFVHLRCRLLIVAIGTAGETACPTLLDQSFGKGGQAVSPAGGS